MSEAINRTPVETELIAMLDNLLRNCVSPTAGNESFHAAVTEARALLFSLAPPPLETADR